MSASLETDGALVLPETDMNTKNADRNALEIARQVHKLAEAKQTILFGSRARGDHRHDSDIDVLVIKDLNPLEPWLENLRQQARDLQKERLPQASGIDIICMTEPDFANKVCLRNNLANIIAKQGILVMPSESVNYGNNYPEERIDWEDVENKITDATGAANWIEAIREAGIIEAGDDKQFGRVAQNALELAYQALLGANGYEYPTSGRDGHNLRMLTDLIREYGIVAETEELPGESHQYLTEFGGGAVYAHEHLPLDRRLIAAEVPTAVAQLKEMVDSA